MATNVPIASLRRLWLEDFRLFEKAEFVPAPEGTTLLVGPNAAGKTSVLEAVAYLATQRSLRGAPRDVLVRTGSSDSVVRADLDVGGRAVLVETEISIAGRSRLLVNRQPSRGRRDLLAEVPVSTFTPAGLELVQGGPATRRELLDDALGLLDRRSGALVDEVGRILRQRGALLTQAGGRLSDDVATSLAVWDERLAVAGTALVEARESVVVRLEPVVRPIYAELAAGEERPGPAGAADAVSLRYRRSWEGSLAGALEAHRRDDLRRGVTSVGPHRDELEIRLGQRDLRTQASQGEQRCVALALRLGLHHLVATVSGIAPILLLDDVFSELDPFRTRALIRELPAAQALITSAGPLPEGVEVDAVVDVRSIEVR